MEIKIDAKKVIAVLIGIAMLFSTISVTYASYKRHDFGIFVKEISKTSCKLDVYGYQSSKVKVTLRESKTGKKVQTKTVWLTYRPLLDVRRGTVKFKKLKRKTNYVASFTSTKSGQKYSRAFKTK